MHQWLPNIFIALHTLYLMIQQLKENQVTVLGSKKAEVIITQLRFIAFAVSDVHYYKHVSSMQLGASATKGISMQNNF